MDDAELRLDGNAAAGVLREVFVYDLSGATGQCASCGAIGEVGGQHLTCSHCRPARFFDVGAVKAFLWCSSTTVGAIDLAYRG